MCHRHKLRKDNYYFAFRQMILQNNFTFFLSSNNPTDNQIIKYFISFSIKIFCKIDKIK